MDSGFQYFDMNGQQIHRHATLPKPIQSNTFKHRASPGNSQRRWLGSPREASYRDPLSGYGQLHGLVRTSNPTTTLERQQKIEVLRWGNILSRIRTERRGDETWPVDCEAISR